MAKKKKTNRRMLFGVDRVCVGQLHCRRCAETMYNRQQAVWHAKGHVLRGEAHAIAGNRLRPIEERYALGAAAEVPTHV